MAALYDEAGAPLLDEAGVEFLTAEGTIPEPSVVTSTNAIGTRTIGVHAIAGDYLPAVVVPAPEPSPFAKHVYSIDLCANWVRIAEAPAATLDAVVRNLAAGEFQLTGAVTAIDFDGAFTLADVDTIRVVRDSTIVFAGYVTPVSSGVGGLHVVDTADGEQFTLTGPDAWSVLNSRVAYPTPATGPPWADAYDLRTGQASTVATGYILNNAGTAATVDRRIPGLSVVDNHVGLSGSWSGRLQPLDQLIARVCQDGGITCRMTVDFFGALEVAFRTPNDRSRTVVISDQGDLTNIDHIRTPAIATYVIAGGQGNLTARTFATAGTAAGSARREVFSDQSSLATGTEVAQSASTTLAVDTASLTVRSGVTDATAAALRYLVAYDIGDTIAIEIAAVRYPVVVASVTIHVSPDLSVIRPILGDAVPNLITGLVRDVANLATRLDTQIA